jgi:LuxR family maltose regulon positive regulatory protein
MNGDLDKAIRAYEEAVQISRAAGNVYMTLITSSNLADVLVEKGELHQAARIYADSLSIATRPDGQKITNADRIYWGLSEILYEWNDLEAASRHVHQCIELCRRSGNLNLLAKAYVMLARLERARHNLDNAQEAMQEADQMVKAAPVAASQSKGVIIAIARWQLSEGNFEMAIRLLQQFGVLTDNITRDGDIPYSQEHEYLLLLRLLLAQGDHDTALWLSERLLRPAKAARRMGRVIEILVLQALTLQGKKDITQAITALAEAISLAQPGGYVRVFLDEGEPMARLLYRVKSQQIGRGYASQLLSALGRISKVDPRAAQILIEPLTSRELEVLGLLDAGDTNQDIADRLVISLPTVKRHISNINTKLGAKNRTQAVSLARELGLFD